MERATGWMRRVMRVLVLVLALSGLVAGESLARPGQGQGHVCEIDRGTVIQQRGSASCSADGTSYAKASGLNLEAIADTGGSAIASGPYSYASAHVGDAFAQGQYSRAIPVDFYSTATAIGTGSRAVAVNGGAATADGFGSSAEAGGTGSIASAVGAHSSATAAGACAVYAGTRETLSCTGPLAIHIHGVSVVQ